MVLFTPDTFATNKLIVIGSKGFLDNKTILEEDDAKERMRSKRLYELKLRHKDESFQKIDNKYNCETYIMKENMLSRRKMEERLHIHSIQHGKISCR